MLHNLTDLVRTPLAFIVVLGVLVAIHEFGHYLAARLCGFHVEAFSIGFGQAVARWTDRHGTAWQIGWLPLGGFVRLHGHMRPDQMSPEERAALRPGQGFHDRSLGARALVTVAGPIANFLLSIALFTALMLAVGRPIPTASVGAVQPGSPAAAAGVQVGDTILSVGGTATTTFADVQRLVISHPGEKLAIVVRRGSQTLSLAATPADRPGPGGLHRGMLGIGSGGVTYRQAGVIESMAGGLTQTWNVVTAVATGLWQVVSGQRSPAELGGVLRIAQMSGQAAQAGPATLLMLMAVLSVNLGLLNLLPIPVLDGGHLLMYGIEAVRGRPLPLRAQEYGTRVGLGFVLALVIFAAVNDLNHFGLFHWVARLMG